MFIMVCHTIIVLSIMVKHCAVINLGVEDGVSGEGTLLNDGHKVPA